VTVIEVSPNLVVQCKTIEKDGYRALQVSTGKRRAKLVTKARAGHFAKAKLIPARILREFRLAENEGNDITVGSELKVDLFHMGQLVDIVTEQSKGKGFQGCVKRHHFRTQDATHGNPVSHRFLYRARLAKTNRFIWTCFQRQENVRSHGCHKVLTFMLTILVSFDIYVNHTCQYGSDYIFNLYSKFFKII
jgi:ribosomal protein L3